MDSTIVVAIIGAVATIVTAIIGTTASRAKDKANAELEQSLKVYKESSIPAKLPTREDIGIEILSPRQLEHVDHVFPVNGTFKSLPEGFEIWVFVYWENGRDIRYWPQTSATVRNNSWYSQVNWLGGEAGEKGRIHVYAVGENGRILIKYFNTAGAENSHDGTQRWPGITELTKDMIYCTSADVILKQ